MATRQVSEETKKIALEKIAQIKVYNLYLLTEVINIASMRGAFKGDEMSKVGTLYDILSTAVNKAYDIAEQETKPPIITEEQK